MSAAPITDVSLAARYYLAAGLKLVAFERGTKGPHKTGWNEYKSCITTPEGAAGLTACNIGLAHAYSHTVCIDVDDLVKARLFFAGVGIDLDAMLAAAGAVRFTSGRPNRVKILYRLPPGAHVLITRMFKANGVELRCATANRLTVQDVLPPSIHPITQAPYYWLGDPDCWRNIPLIPADLYAFWQALNAPSPWHDDDVNAAPIGCSREDIESLLARIDPKRLEYDDWLHVGMALHHETAGAAVGLDIWDDWSQRGGAKYKGREELAGKWPGFHLDRANPRTLRSIEYLAGPDDFAGELDAIADKPTPAGTKQSGVTPNTSALRVQPISLATLKAAPREPEIIVEQLLLMDACGFVAPGGTGKTTLAIYECIHIVLGRDLWGRRIVHPGRVLFVTAEDSQQIIEDRVNHICKALALTDAEVEIVAGSFFIEDLSMVNARLVGVNPKGAIYVTQLLSAIVTSYRDMGISLIHLDPASLLGPGEQSGNDGMAALMKAARRLSYELRAACQIVHHVAQVVARSGIQDQYAGRGGTAFADNSRGQRQLVRIKERGYEFDGRRYQMPESISDDQLAEGAVLAILVHKLSYVKRDPRPIFILRRDYSFRQFEAEADSAKAADATRDEIIQAAAGFIARELQSGHQHSANTLETVVDEWKPSGSKLSQKKARAVILDAITRGVFVYVKNPKRGGAQEFLTVALDVPDDVHVPP